MNDGGKAFPSFERLTMLRRMDITPEQKETIYIESQGMTLRDYFAAKAPTAELALPRFTPADVREYLGEQSKHGEFPAGNWMARVHAKARYQFANAMLAERAKHE